MPLKAPAGMPPGWVFCGRRFLGFDRSHAFFLGWPGGLQSMSVPVAPVQALPTPKLLG
jgi:hypothetical protein